MSLHYSLHCAWCDRRFSNKADLIAHEAEHRHNTELRNSENLARGLERAAEAGLRAEKEAS